jgi:hypothetical protein
MPLTRVSLLRPLDVNAGMPLGTVRNACCKQGTDRQLRASRKLEGVAEAALDAIIR